MYIPFTEINVNKSHILESKGAIFSTFTNSNLMSKSSFEKRRMNKWLQKKRFLKTFKQPVMSYLYHIWSIIMGVKLAYRLFAVLIIWKPLLLRWPNIWIYWRWPNIWIYCVFIIEYRNDLNWLLLSSVPILTQRSSENIILYTL